jgi:hypothetical protein
MEMRQNKTVLQVLIEARAMIADPNNWCRGDYFIDNRCCPLGAIAATIGKPKNFWGGEAVFNHPANLALSEAMGEAVHKFNDDESHSHADILAAFDKAIENEQDAH